MVVGALRAELHLPTAQSLKDKRALIKGLKDRLRGKFNVAVAEVDTNDTWQRVALGIVAVGGERAYVDRLLEEVVQWLQVDRMVALMRVEQERW